MADLDIDSSITVRARNKMYGKLQIMSIGRADLNASINTIVHSNLSSSIQIPPHNRMFGKMVVSSVAIKDVDSSIGLRLPNDLSSAIRIAPHNKMYGALEVILPPLTTVTLDAISDSYVRELRPNQNFGATQDMFVGKSLSGETYRSLLFFDILTIPPVMTIKSAKLILQHANPHDTQNVIGFYDAIGDWTENGVTWANQPVSGDLLQSGNSGVGQTTVEIDFTDPVTEWHKGIRENNGFIMKMVDQFYLSTARYHTTEYSPKRPKLVIEYFDPTVNTFGSTFRQSSITVVRAGSIEVDSALTVRSNNYIWEQDASILVRDPKERPGSLTVSRPDLDSSILVVKSDKSDLDSSVTIMSANYTELDTVLHVSTPEISSSIYVRPYSDLSSSMTSKAQDVNDLTSSISVNRQEMDGSIYVRAFSDINASITARAKGTSDLDGVIVSNKPDLYSDIYVRPYNDLTSSVIARRSDISNLDSSIAASRPDMTGQAYVRYRSEVLSEVTVIGNSVADLTGVIHIPYSVPSSLQVWYVSVKDGSLSVSRPNMDGSLFVMQPYDETSSVSIRRSALLDLDGDLSVRRSADSDLSSSVSVRVVANNDQDSSVDVFYTSNLDASISVNRYDQLDVNSSISIRTSDLNDLESTTYVKFTDDITGDLFVRTDSANDLDSSISVRLDDISDITATINVFMKEELVGSITVKRKDVYDIPTTIVLRFNDDIDSDITIIPMPSGNSDLTSSITIQVEMADGAYAFIM